ncbi:MAG TPA: response regulator transcription factor [Streptosporangiaceae bacterium]|nr:response regulator transcription factor [Streptosporangiaceae bacterium]
MRHRHRLTFRRDDGLRRLSTLNLARNPAQRRRRGGIHESVQPFLRMIRAISKVAVVVATARDDEQDIVKVLDAGADDYLVKPFGVGQIEARVRAVLRRAVAMDERRMDPIVVGELRLDEDAHEATLDNQPLDLSRREFELLYYLAARAGQVVTKRELLTHVWRMPYGGADKTVDVHVSWLRRKLGENAQHPKYLQTIRGVGVKLAAPT